MLPLKALNKKRRVFFLVKIFRIEKGNLSPDDALEQFFLVKRAKGLAEVTLIITLYGI